MRLVKKSEGADAKARAWGYDPGEVEAMARSIFERVSSHKWGKAGEPQTNCLRCGATLREANDAVCTGQDQVKE